MIPIKGSDFVRDEATGALININVNAFQQYKHRREQQKVQVQQEQEINDLKNEVAELKDLITKLLESKNV